MLQLGVWFDTGPFGRLRAGSPGTPGWRGRKTGGSEAPPLRKRRTEMGVVGASGVVRGSTRFLRVFRLRPRYVVAVNRLRRRD